MSRFKEYITEGNLTLEQAIEGIKKDCKPFLKDIKGTLGTLVRMQGGTSSNPFLLKTIRKEREPLDTFEPIHEITDNWFNKEFGWKARSNVIFCWGKPFSNISDILTNYYLVFPVGKYKYVWSPEVNDLTEYLEADKDFYHGKHPEKEEMDDILDRLVDAKYTDKNIRRAVVSYNEVMINAKSAYMVSTTFLKEVNEKLELSWQGIRK